MFLSQNNRAPVLGTTVEKIGKGQENIVLEKVGKNRQKNGKPRQTLKNTKYIHFFQNFKHIKQQQHQINSLAHKYGESTNIYDVVDAKTK
jgi:hypothetical protein